MAPVPKPTEGVEQVAVLAPPPAVEDDLGVAAPPVLLHEEPAATVLGADVPLGLSVDELRAGGYWAATDEGRPRDTGRRTRGGVCAGVTDVGRSGRRRALP